MLLTSLNWILGYFAASRVIACWVASATPTALAPTARVALNPTIGLPSRSASERCSAAWSRTLAMASRRTVLLSGRRIGSAARSCTEAEVATVRTLCSWLPTRASPPGSSTWVRFSCLEMSPAVVPRAFSALGSRSTRISRSTPPTRLMEPIPSMELSSRLTVRSTNQDNSSSLIVAE